MSSDIPRPSSPNFSGKWRLQDSENFDPFLQDIQIGYLKRKAVCVISSEHHIEQEGDKMTVNVHAMGRAGKKQDYNVGECFDEVEINGQEAQVCTEWDGDTIKEIHKTDTFEYSLVRELQDDKTMVLNLQSPTGIKARRVYKKYE